MLRRSWLPPSIKKTAILTIITMITPNLNWSIILIKKQNIYIFSHNWGSLRLPPLPDSGKEEIKIDSICADVRSNQLTVPVSVHHSDEWKKKPMLFTQFNTAECSNRKKNGSVLHNNEVWCDELMMFRIYISEGMQKILISLNYKYTRINSLPHYPKLTQA